MSVRCPECEFVADFQPVGPYRSLCGECGALVKNREIGVQDYNDPAGEYLQMRKVRKDDAA